MNLFNYTKLMKFLMKSGVNSLVFGQRGHQIKFSMIILHGYRSFQADFSMENF